MGLRVEGPWNFRRLCFSHSQRARLAKIKQSFPMLWVSFSVNPKLKQRAFFAGCLLGFHVVSLGEGTVMTSVDYPN